MAATYDLRFAPDDSTAWERMEPVAGLPSPRPHGSPEAFRATGLRPNVSYRFLLRSVDEAANWSAPSNPAWAMTAGSDRIPPAAIRDLRVARADPTSVTLRWTASGDDSSSGLARSYDIRYLRDPPSSSGWDQAVRASGPPLPLPAGSTEEFTLTGLSPRTLLYKFFVRAVDEAGNLSPLAAPAAIRTGSDEDAGWSDAFAPPPDGVGLDGSAYALVVFDGHLVAGGLFHRAGPVNAENIAAWDGSSWIPLGAGLNGSAGVLCPYQGALVAGGAFTTAGGTFAPYVARWSGACWGGLGDGLTRPVYSLASAGDNLYAADLTPSVHVWDGGRWSDLPPAPLSARSLCIFRGDLYAGGHGWFGSPSDTLVRIARWSSGRWTLSDSMGGVVPIPEYDFELVDAFAGTEDALWAASTYGAVQTWDGTAWRDVSLPLGVEPAEALPAVLALCPWQGRMVVGGWFYSRPPGETFSILVGGSGGWQGLGTGVGGDFSIGYDPDNPWLYRRGEVVSLAVYQDRLYAGGNFRIAGGKPSGGIARWDR